jgi:S-adenosylmethionine decarboxylase
MDNYSKGLHILLTLKVNQSEKLLDFEKFYQFSKKILADNDAEMVGETHHIFENDSFTAAICLKESHICVLKWVRISDSLRKRPRNFLCSANRWDER